MSLSIIVDKGFEFASDFLSYLREGDERQERIHMANLERQKEFDSNLLASIKDISEKLDVLAQDVANRVSIKLESDQLEKLISQIKSVRFALEFNDKNMLSVSLVNIMDQIEYAKRRILEDKYEWLGPWMMAESIRIVSLRKMANDKSSMDMVYQEALTFRINILDYTGSAIIKPKSAPWREIADFVDGKNENLLKLISQSRSDSTKNSSATYKNVKLPSTENNQSAKVVKIMASIGDTVNKGDILIIVEADKSIIEITAETTGILHAINVEPGDEVRNETILLSIKI